ncbi:Crp/Fnr family transcriptional regulator [Anaerolentibacter hominis]|uniref:Crp/Fnr family transcriptional regulator n=1 Tax=Anaerolentibacter hominis TaxID=3079009 RepID=UPI0031B8267C
MKLNEVLPFWSGLTKQQQDLLAQTVTIQRVSEGTLVHNGTEDCVGLLIVLRGRLRAYILSEEGREITLYRLLERDLCLFSASCMMKSIQFDISVEAETDTEFYHIPVDVYQTLMKQSAQVANYTNEVMAARFSDVMWLLDQILYKRIDARLAAFLLEEESLSQKDEIKITHEAIARNLGSAREVITRILKYLQNDGLVTVSRGSIKILDEQGLRRLAGDSIR